MLLNSQGGRLFSGMNEKNSVVYIYIWIEEKNKIREK
jgi:hypothetical protein